MDMSVREVQKILVRHFSDATKKVGAKLYLADIVTSPRPTFWFCGTSKQRQQLVKLLNENGLRIFSLNGQKRGFFNSNLDHADHTVVYSKYVEDGVVIHGAASGIEVAFCEYLSESDLWFTRRAGVESEATTSYLNDLDFFSFLNIELPVLRNANALIEQCRDFDKVDVVFTWVDGDDPRWKRRKMEASHSIDSAHPTGDATHPTRFKSQHELMYSIRSVLRYFVNVGNIFVVTDNQTPAFLGNLMHRVKIVDHRDIMSEEYTPTFNSHAIEANLHHIPNLREYYLYMNDDMFFASALSSFDFFDEYGRSRQFYSKAKCLPNIANGHSEVAATASGINNRNLISGKFGYFSFRKFQHTAIATRKSIMFEMEKDIPQAWRKTLPNRFRSHDDFSIAGALYNQYSAARGLSVPGTLKYLYLPTTSRESSKAARVLLEDDWIRPQTFCVNDTEPTEFSDQTKDSIMKIVGKLLPQNGGILQNLAKPQSSIRRRWWFFGPKTNET